MIFLYFMLFYIFLFGYILRVLMFGFKNVEGEGVGGGESLVGVKESGLGVERVCFRVEIIGRGRRGDWREEGRRG